LASGLMDNPTESEMQSLGTVSSQIQHTKQPQCVNQHSGPWGTTSFCKKQDFGGCQGSSKINTFGSKHCFAPEIRLVELESFASLTSSR
jgi:hypothetical protein